MSNSNLIHSELFASGASTLSTFFTLETKVMGGEGGGLLHTEWGNAAEDMVILIMVIV
jgi:hypothetical protein